MSKLSIYESGWLNLVFEGKNKDYGAYQLRKESDKTTAMAFLLGLLMVALVIAVPKIINYSSATTPLVMPDTDMIVKISNYKPNKPEPVKKVLPVTPKKTTDLKKQKQLVNPEIVKPTDANDNISKNTNNKPQPDTQQGTGTEVTTPVNTSNGGTTTTVNAPADSGDGIEKTTSLDKLPEFPGGIERFYAYVGKNFNNPEIEESKTVRVYISFVIEKDGSMTDIQVKRDPGYGLAKEAIRVLKSLKTKWEPGFIKGKPVRTSYNLPITVQMQ